MDWLDYFSGGVPSAEFFRMTLDDLREISRMDTVPEGGIHRLQELCFIGLVSYFEAFCKDHFASLINIEPQLISNLKAAGQNVEVDSTRMVFFTTDMQHHVGFVLAEKYDFGSAKKVNALFSSLIRVSPFSSDEAETYDEILRDRNLVVHHGGTFTLSYLEQSPVEGPKARAFYDSRAIGAGDVVAAIGFIEAIARKLARSSHAALVEYLMTHDTECTGERKKALDGLIWWGDSPA